MTPAYPGDDTSMIPAWRGRVWRRACGAEQESFGCFWSQAVDQFTRKELIEIKAYSKFKERGFTKTKEEEILDYQTSEAEVEVVGLQIATKSRCAKVPIVFEEYV
eukprot:1191098-Prorocentrum_minimum.AAC.2